MTVNSTDVDILHLRTTNMNVRISPLLKMNIIEHGAKMGVNLSDYINYLLTKSMSIPEAVEMTPQYKALENAYAALDADNGKLEEEVRLLQDHLEDVQAELSKYELAIEPYKKNVGKPITIGGKVYEAHHPSELLPIILNSFKFKN